MKHIHRILQQRDEMMQDTEWVLGEAMSGKRLQSGGTFRNVLSHKLDEVIIPIFAEVLTFVGHYSNLELLRRDSPAHIHRIWLNVFRNQEFCKFSYAEMVTRSAGVGQRMSLAVAFHCQFPFFWLLKEVVDSLCDKIISVTGIWQESNDCRGNC